MAPNTPSRKMQDGEDADEMQGIERFGTWTKAWPRRRKGHQLCIFLTQVWGDSFAMVQSQEVFWVAVAPKLDATRELQH